MKNITTILTSLVLAITSVAAMATDETVAEAREAREAIYAKCSANAVEAKAVQADRSKVVDLAASERDVARTALSARQRDVERIGRELKCGGSNATAQARPQVPSVGGLTTIDSVVVVRELANRNADMTLALANVRAPSAGNATVTTTLVNTYPENGKEYCDAAGNCRRSTQGGSMLCENAINGQILERDFAPHGLSLEQAKSYCRMSGDKFLARHQGTTPSAQSAQEQVPQALRVSDVSASGKIECPIRFNGQEVARTTVGSHAECQAWMAKYAADRGWTPSK